MSNSAKSSSSEIHLLREQLEDLRCALIAVVLLLIIIAGVTLFDILDLSSPSAFSSSLTSTILFLLLAVPLFLAALCGLFTKPDPSGPRIVYEDQKNESE